MITPIGLVLGVSIALFAAIELLPAFERLAFGSRWMAVGGLVRTSWAGEVVALLVIVTFLIDLVVPALRWPDWLHQLALTSHLGQPMVGLWDGPGMVLCLALAFGGLALGAWGIARRDVQR